VEGDGAADTVATVTTDANGAATITVEASDVLSVDGSIDVSIVGEGLSASATATAVNDAPELTGDAAAAGAADEDNAETVSASDLLAGYTDEEGDALSVENVVADNGATVTDNGDGTFTIEPAADFNGEVVVSYDVTDGTDSTAASWSIDFAPVNDAPTVENAEVTETATEAGDVVVGQLEASDVDGDELTFTLDAPVEGLTLNADGSYSFDPAQNTAAQALTYTDEPLEVVATYTVSDGNGGEAQGSLTVTVEPTPLTFTLESTVDTVEEGSEVGYTIVASEAVQEEFTGEIQIALEDGDTASLNDFGSGSFNPQPVTIAEGETTSTVATITPTNDAETETPETFTATATVDGYDIESIETTVQDPSSVGGLGQTFTLTTGVDTIPGMEGSAGSTGTDGNDTIVSLLDGANSTLTSLDSINGGLGQDTIIVNSLAAVNALPTGATVTNVESATFRAADDLTADTTAWADLENVTVEQTTGDLTLTVADTVTADVSGVTGANSVTGGESVTVAQDLSDGGSSVAVNDAGDVTVTGTDSAKLVTFTTTFTGSASGADVIKVVDDNATTDTTLSDGDNAEDIAAAVAATDYTDWTAVDNGDGSVTFTAVDSSIAMPGTPVTATDAGTAGTPGIASAETVGINIGGTTAVTGEVNVTATGAAVNGGDGAITLDDVSVTGGSTVNVTQVAAESYGDAATEAAGGDVVTQGAVTVQGTTDTTEVNVKQDAAVNATAAVDAVAGEAATQEITFQALAAGEKVSLNFGDPDGAGVGTASYLTFTAKKSLTAEEVAAAFANLANGDVQGGASARFGIYENSVDGGVATGGVVNGWSSDAVEVVDADNAKVVFSNDNANPDAIADNASDQLGTVGAVTAGTAQVDAVEGNYGISNGVVDIEDNATEASITTITVDGYANLSDIGSDFAATTALETLNLANAEGTASMTVEDTAATLALSLEGLGSSTGDAGLTFTNAPTTLNVTNTGNNFVDLQADDTVSLSVAGTGVLDINNQDLDKLETVEVTGQAGLTLNAGVNNTVTSVDTTGTTGTVTTTIKGDTATYAGGAGIDNLTINNPGTAIDKSIDLGAGDDRLDLSGATPATPSTVIEAGEGTDTLVLAAADAANDALTGSTAFESQINGFEHLELGQAAADETVNLDNLDDINYVITNGDGGNALTLDKMLNGATVEFTAAGTGTTEVKLADASGGADQVNLIANAADTSDLGTVTADKVESINITANDTLAGVGVSTNTLTLDADAAANVSVTGEGNLVLKLDAATTEVTTVDASTMNGALTLETLAADTAATTVTGGSAADTLTAKGANDVLIGGAGDDALAVSGAGAVAATLTGGEGTDSFDVSGYTVASPGSAVTITDLEEGETIQFASNATANFATGKVEYIEEAGFGEWVTEAAKQADAAAELFGDAQGASVDETHGIAWFNFNQNTFIVQDVDGDGNFTEAGGDLIVKLTGVYDLSNSSFNADGEGTLEYIA